MLVGVDFCFFGVWVLVELMVFGDWWSWRWPFLGVGFVICCWISFSSDRVQCDACGGALETEDAFRWLFRACVIGGGGVLIVVLTSW